MSPIRSKKISRRAALAGLGGFVACAPSILRAETVQGPSLDRRVSGFTLHRWQDHFDAVGKGVILSDTEARMLQHWTPDGDMRVYPTSVPLTEDMTRLGHTQVVRKVNGPEWRPTPSMMKRDPDLPPYVGPGPENPLGTHALYLSWQYYRIHGTNDTRKIGRRSSSGCIGLYNEHIEEVFARTPVGTRVKLI